MFFLLKGGCDFLLGVGMTDVTAPPASTVLDGVSRNASATRLVGNLSGVVTLTRGLYKMVRRVESQLVELFFLFRFVWVEFLLCIAKRCDT